jgi:hypothetical protein
VGERVVVDTLYGDPTNPFPLSISFTGLAWHDLLSVGVDCHEIGKALTEGKPTKTIFVSLTLGIAWGLWAVWWQTNPETSVMRGDLGPYPLFKGFRRGHLRGDRRLRVSASPNSIVSVRGLFYGARATVSLMSIFVSRLFQD